MPLRRKKWTEEEERTLLDKYAEMVADGTLTKMKTRERKFQPIAAHVNALHHARDPSVFPWLWSWKDASTKVQNMRHQYLLVKHKIKRPSSSDSAAAADEDYDWLDGLSHWPNFLRYKEVFGDVPDSPPRRPDGARGLGLGLGIESDGDDDGDGDDNVNCDGRENGNGHNGNLVTYDEAADEGGGVLRKKRKKLRGIERRAMALVLERFAELKAHERERRRRLEEERERWDAMEREYAERERRRREEEAVKEREWEERMEQRRADWRKRMDEAMAQHRAQMEQLQSRIIHEQQSIVNQLLGVVSQWTGHSAGITDHTGTAGNPYLSQMIPNLHHVNGIDSRVGDENNEDQFIVDE